MRREDSTVRLWLTHRQFLHGRYAGVLRLLASDRYAVQITAAFQHDEFGPSSACFNADGEWDGRVCCTINFSDLHVPSRDYVLCSRPLIEESPAYGEIWAAAAVAGHLQQFLEFSVLIDDVHHGFWQRAVRQKPSPTIVQFLRPQFAARIGWRLRFVIHAAVINRWSQRELAAALADDNREETESP